MVSFGVSNILLTVGRTGSSKSSLMLSLLRLIPTEGEIRYDGIETNSINLESLRQNITIIPQQPELLVFHFLFFSFHSLLKSNSRVGQSVKILILLGKARMQRSMMPFVQLVFSVSKATFQHKTGSLSIRRSPMLETTFHLVSGKYWLSHEHLFDRPKF